MIDGNGLTKKDIHCMARIIQSSVFAKGQIFYEIDKTTSKLSDEISKDLQKRGMKFVGSTIIYSYLQAIGIIYSHDKECYKYENKESFYEK